MQKNQGNSLFQLLIVETFIFVSLLSEILTKYLLSFLKLNVQCTMLCEFLSFFSAMQIKYFNGMSSSHEIYLYIKSKEYVMSIGRTKKSQNCEEGGAHLRIFVWHLLMKLKNNYLLKNF